MKKLIIFATVVLLVQIGLVAVLNLGSHRSQMAAVDTDFVGAAVTGADNLTITDGEGKSLQLELKDGSWLLPASQNATADKLLVTNLLTKIGSLKEGFTVATSDEAVKRFKVADDDFERHIVLKKDGKSVADFYLGTSPGFRQVHARKNGEKGVVALALSTFEFDTGAEKWLDKAVLQLKAEDLKAIRMQDIALTRNDKKWVLESEAQGEPVQEQVDDLVGRITSLTVQNLLAPEKSKELFVGAIGLQLNVETNDGRKLSYDFVKDGEDSYAVKRSDQELVYSVHKIVVDGLLGFNREKLLTQNGPSTADNGVSEDGVTEPAGPAAPASSSQSN